MLTVYYTVYRLYSIESIERESTILKKKHLKQLFFNEKNKRKDTIVIDTIYR